MRLTVVGCSGGFPTAQSAASCYLVEHDGVRIVLDMGNGALGELARHVDLADDDCLAGVVLSHCHIDHCADVGSLYVLRRYRPGRAFPMLPVLGPVEAPERLAAIYGMADPEPLRHEFDLRAFDARPTTIGPFTITTVRADHPVEAYCVRIDAGGRSLTYSGDTGPTAALVGLATGTDVALFEATFVGEEGPPNLHMSAGDAGRVAQSAGAALLLLSHHMLWNDPQQVLVEASAHFSGPIEQARPGLTISV